MYKFNQELGNYEVDKEYLDKMLNGKLDYSFELVENEELTYGINIEKINNKLYTLDVINVKYTKKYKKTGEQKTTKELKDWTYVDGFKFNGNQMINWKRSGGKARVGENLFVLESIRSIIEWARMGLKFEGKTSIASIRAYESLPLSSIIGTVNLNPNSILVLDDYISKFNWTMSKTWLEDGELKTETVPTEERNSIWDGEGLLSSKIFDENEIIKGRGVALLRNRFMKCAGFCCYIEKFFRKYCEDNGYDYDTYEIKDMYENTIKVKDVLLITTPSAIKLLKYNDEVLKVDGYAKYKEGAWLRYWKDNCGEVFGVCKTEKPSHLCEKDENGEIITYRNCLSYQMVNTIPFTKEEMKRLVATEIQYINKLKNDLSFFLKEVNQTDEMEVNYDNDEENDSVIEKGSNIDVMGAFLQLSKRNPNFVNTQVFKDFKRNFINAYISEVRQGKIRIESDYCIACGNPIELLKATVGEFNGTSQLNDNELYCSRFKDGEDIVGFRNPHINVANIGIQKQKYIQEIEDYMKVTPNIVYLNSIKYPILSTYQGEDFDIDANLFTNNKIIVKACNRIDKEITPIPFNAIENTGSNDTELTGQNMSDVDHTIAKNYIGSVINLSQEINSLYNHLKYNNLASDKDLKQLYDRTSRLSSISQCEIDKAKKQFEELNVPRELEKMKIGLELVDDLKISKIKKEINAIKVELEAKKIKIRDFRTNKRKPINTELRKCKNKMIINDKMKLSNIEVKSLQDILIELQLKLPTLNETEVEQIKIINKKIRVIKKTLFENEIEKLTEAERLILQNKILKLETIISNINLEKQEEVDTIKNRMSEKYEELKKYDSRRIKPYFFKFIGDNESKKQRIVTNKKHRRDLDKPIISKYCIENKIDIKGLDRKNKELLKILKVNDSIQKEWENKIYDKEIDTPMNWLNLELDKIKNNKKVGTTQVINLVKKNTNSINKETVEYVVNIIKELDIKIKGYKSNKDLKIKDKMEKIKFAKEEVSKNILSLKLIKVNLYGVMKETLNTCKKNGKIDKKSGIESISLEILFQTYGNMLLDMFCQQ